MNTGEVVHSPLLMGLDMGTIFIHNLLIAA